MRSAIMPTTGTLSPPVPQANPRKLHLAAGHDAVGTILEDGHNNASAVGRHAFDRSIVLSKDNAGDVRPMFGRGTARRRGRRD
jgi:hypothetical protein